MADQWFYQLLGQEFGPVEFSELLSLRDAGSLSGSDSVRRDSETTCISFDNAVQSKEGSIALAEVSESDLNIDDFVIEKREEPVPEKELRFYVRSNGTTIGPLTSIDFCRLADAGKIDVRDEVRCNDEDWRNASEFPEVMAAQLVSGLTMSPPSAAQSKPPAKKRKTNGRKRVPKKRRQKVDEELQGVFDEVFGPNGTLKQKEEAGNVAASKDLPTSTSDDTTEVARGVSDTSPELPVLPKPALTPAAPSASQTLPPVRPWTPPPKRKKSLSERFDFDSRTLSIAGGILGVVLLGCLFPFIGLGSLFGASVPTASSVESTLNEYVSQYEKVKASDGEWNEFATEVRSTVGGIIKDYRESSGHMQARDIELKQAATCLIQLANCRRDDTAGHELLLSDFKKHLTGSG